MVGLSEVDMYFVYYICALLCGCKCYARCNEKERRFTYVKQQGMLTLELSSYVLGIPNDAQSKFDWLHITQSRALQADWLILQNNEKATLNINMR